MMRATLNMVQQLLGTVSGTSISFGSEVVLI